MKSSKCLVANKDVILRQEGDDAFLFNPEDGNLICVNALGAFIWKHCNANKNREDIISLIRNDYPDTPETQISKDFDSFVGQLQKIEFLKTKR